MSFEAYSFLGQTEGEKKAFLEVAKRGSAAWNYPQEHLVVIRDEKSLSFSGIRNNPISPPSYK